MRTGNELKSQIVKGIQRLAKTTTPQIVFRHWCEAMALAIQNACLIPGTQRWKQNEEAYLAIVKAVGSDAMQEFKRLFELYQELLTVAPWNDWFGEIYMEIGGDSKKGQFFTPYHLSKVCANMSVGVPPDDDSPITINEPSCGAGGMIVATLEAMNEKGINWQRRARIVASDIDTLCVHMSYVTLSLLGVRAKVLHQDTLRLKTWSVWHTPREMLWPIMDYDWSKPAENASECSQIAPDLTKSAQTDENTSKPENAEKRKSAPKQMCLF